jgi:hypothetical protein
MVPKSGVSRRCGRANQGDRSDRQNPFQVHKPDFYLIVLCRLHTRAALKLRTICARRSCPASVMLAQR